MSVRRPDNILFLSALLASMFSGLPLMTVVIAAPHATAQSNSSANEVRSDYNGDGEDDLAIGVPFEDVGSINAAGAVNVLYGSSSSGLQTSSPTDQFWTQNSPGVDDASEPDDHFGSDLATGDFNGDGFDDLAIGVPEESVGTVEGAGAVNVLYGSSLGLRSTPAADGSGRADQFWTQNSTGVEDTAEPGEGIFSSLSVGDFNGDGFDDLAIGVPSERHSNQGLPRGGVHILYGSASGLQTASPEDQFWTQNSPGVDDYAENEDAFGITLAAGDFNGDGFDDLAIGVPWEDTPAAQGGCSPGTITPGCNAGAVNILYGSASGLQTSSPADQFWNQDSPGVNDISEEGDLFGTSTGFRSGDFNDDGYYDVAVGVRGEDIGTIDDAGAVHVLYGSASGLQTSSPADQFWNQDSPGVEDNAEPNDMFGSDGIRRL